MKETKIMKVFESYIKKFDMNKGNIKAMYFHSIKMMELCKDIASNVGVFDDEEILVCGIIGLFHDISLYSNKNKNCIFLDSDDDCTKDTIDILFDKDKLIRDVIGDSKYDNYIKLAIYCHNKNGLPKGVDKKTIEFCKVIKDAHVIDSFRMVTHYPYMDMNIDNMPSSLVYNDFKKYKVVSAKVSDNDADKILEVMSLVFGMYYPYSCSLVKEEDCINKLIDSLYIKDKKINKFFKQIAGVMNLYLDRKIGGKNA